MRFVYAPANHNRVNCLPSPSLTPEPQVRVYKCLIVQSSMRTLLLILIVCCNQGVYVAISDYFTEFRCCNCVFDIVRL